MIVQEEAMPGESLVSYLAREAAANGFSRTLDYLLARYRTADLPFSWLIAFGADKTSHWAGILTDQEPSNRGPEARFLQLQPRRFCPLCLRDGHFWRASWEYTLVAFCPIHRVWLEDRCVACNSSVEFWDSPPNCPTCGAELRLGHHPELIVDEKALILAQMLSRSTEDGGWTPDLVDLETPWVLPEPLSYEQLSRIVVLLGAYASGRHGKPRKVSFKNDIGSVRNVVTKAAHSLFPWPSAFHALLSSLRDSSQKSLTGKMSYFYKALYTEFMSTEVGFLQREVESYLRESWDGVFDHRHRYMSEQMLEGQRHQSASVAARRLGLSRGEVLSAIQQGRIQGRLEPLASGRTRATVRFDLLEEVAPQLLLLSLKEVGAELGLPSRRVKELVKHQILPGREPVKGGVWAIPRAAVFTLCDRLLRVAAGVAPDHRAKPIGHAVRYMPVAAQAFASLLVEVLAGRIRISVIEDAALPLFARLHIDLAELRRWQLLEVGSLSVPHAAELMGLKQEVAYQLFHRGLLRASARDGGFPALTQDDIGAFQTGFVLAKEVAAARGWSSRRLREMLASREIHPISGPGIDGGRQVVYERRPLMRVLGDVP